MAIEHVDQQPEEPSMARDARTESLLDDWGIEYELDEQFPLARLEIKDSAQVRAEAHRAPRESVEEFTLQMRHGAIFPPLVATKAGTLLDGNTRRAAAVAIGRQTFPTYVVKLPRPDYGPMIGAALNQTGGNRLTPEEAFAAAQLYIDAGFTDDNISRLLGKSRPSVFNYRRQHAFQEAAKRTGVADVKVKPIVQRQLAEISMDAPFKAAVEVAAQTAMGERESKELVAQIAQARSEGEQLEVIESHRQKHPAVGPRPRKKTTTAIATKARQHVRGLLAYSAAELAPATLRADLEPEWRNLKVLAEEVLAAFADAGSQEELELAQAPTDA